MRMDALHFAATIPSLPYIETNFYVSHCLVGINNSQFPNTEHDEPI
jgi:hypothetical protein